LYLLLLVICVLPAKVPVYVTYCALPFGALILATRLWKKEWVPNVLRFTLYLLIPVVVYAGNQACAPWAAGFPMHLCNVSFGALAFLDIAVSKLSQRRDGFKSTPLDFLILLLAFGYRTFRNWACMRTRSAWSRPRSSSCTSASRW